MTPSTPLGVPTELDPAHPLRFLTSGRLPRTHLVHRGGVAPFQSLCGRTLAHPASAQQRVRPTEYPLCNDCATIYNQRLQLYLTKRS